MASLGRRMQDIGRLRNGASLSGNLGDMPNALPRLEKVSAQADRGGLKKTHSNRVKQCPKALCVPKIVDKSVARSVSNSPRTVEYLVLSIDEEEKKRRFKV